jgi:UDP-N-acetyl-D-mannosaminuronic acid dehydrogenase
MSDKSICVIGLGYIGLPTATLLASRGYHVAGVDVTQAVVDTINQGRIHIVEPDLDGLVRSTVEAGRLKAHLAPQVSDIYMICVPTPFHEGEGIPSPNLDYVLTATQSIAPLVKAGDLVILESTSPVGTTDLIAEALAKAGVDLSKIHIAYCPERVLPGRIMIELVENDRVVGGYTPEAASAVGEFYRSFVRGGVLETDAKTAEMCKLTENSFRDVNIAFANELSLICAKEGIDVSTLIRLANRHPRVNILQPGTGVGGHCIAVDPWFIVARNPDEAKLIRTAREVNNSKTHWVAAQIAKAAEQVSRKDGTAPIIACLGLAFKPDIDDLRESPAVSVVESLMTAGHTVMAVEPHITAHAKFSLAQLDSVLATADVIAILVKHGAFTDEVIRYKLIQAGALDFCGALA